MKCMKHMKKVKFLNHRGTGAQRVVQGEEARRHDVKPFVT
jgi:hypothetical protein